MKVRRLGNCENFVGKREQLVFDAFIDFEPVERAQDGIWQDLEALMTARVRELQICWRLREFTVERITVVKFGVNDRVSNGTSS